MSQARGTEEGMECPNCGAKGDERCHDTEGPPARFVSRHKSRPRTEESLVRELEDALSELYAMVKGECPSLLHEDESDIGFIVEQALKRAAATPRRRESLPTSQDERER